MTASTTYVALLRAVNVGGRKAPMSELRDCLEQLGHQDVRTYLQSGNAVFRGAKAPSASVAAAIEAALRERFGFDIPTAVFTARELADVVEANPYAAEAGEPTTVIVSFLPEAVPANVADAFDLSDFPERGQVGDRVLYLHYPNGQGRSKLVPAVLERRLGGIWGTARNWRTVMALHDMTQS